MVTNMISQLQWELPAQVCGQFFWNFIHKMASRCEDGTLPGDFLDELPMMIKMMIASIYSNF